MRMEVDVLDYVTEGILLMECEDKKWWLVAFLSKISKWDWEKLQDSWQGDVGSNKRVGKLETFAERCKIQVQGLNRL